MKEIGHAYVAEKVTNLTEQNIYIGCLVPDLVWYTSAQPALEKADLHGQGAVQFFNWIENNAPDNKPLALAVLSHGVLYGADKFMDKSYDGGLGFAYQYSQPLEEKVAKCSHISMEVARVRAHNFIELGLDLLLSQKHPELVDRIEKGIHIADLARTADFLSRCFKSDEELILKGLSEFAACYTPGDLKSAEGLAQIWARQCVGLPDGDVVDIPLATEVIKEAADRIENDYLVFLDATIAAVSGNLTPFL